MKTLTLTELENLENPRVQVINNDSVCDFNLKDLSKLTYTQRLTGLKSKATLGDTTTWTVEPGIGRIVDSYSNPLAPVARMIEFTTEQVYSIPAILNGTTITHCYAYYRWDGSQIVLDYQESAPTADDLVDKFFLAAIISNDGLNIDDVRAISLADEPYTKRLLDLGAINVDRVYPQPINGTMRLSFPGGNFKFAGRNAFTTPKTPHTVPLSPLSEINYFLCDPDGNVLSQETDFNFNRYWNGSAAVPLIDIESIGVNYVFVFPSGGVAVVLGENEFDSLALAATAQAYDRWLPDKFKHNTYFCGIVAGTTTATNIKDPSQVALIWR